MEGVDLNQVDRRQIVDLLRLDDDADLAPGLDGGAKPRVDRLGGVVHDQIDAQHRFHRRGIEKYDQARKLLEQATQAQD